QAPAPAGLGRADALEELSAGAGGLGDQVDSLVSPVGRHLPAGRRRVLARADGLEEHLVGRDPDLEAHRPLAVVELEPVVPGAGNQPRSRRDRLVAGAGDLEIDLVLPLELDLLVVDPAREIDVAVGRRQRGRVEAVVLARLDLGRHAGTIAETPT